VWALAWFAEQHRQRRQCRSELLRVLRSRFAFLWTLSNRHGLSGFNPHRSMHRLVLPPEPASRPLTFKAAFFGTGLGPRPAAVADPELPIRRSKKRRRRGRFDLNGRRLKRGEHASWCSHDTRRGCNCGAESEETSWRASRAKCRGRKK
jgi:hypothetical protein